MAPACGTRPVGILAHNVHARADRCGARNGYGATLRPPSMRRLVSAPNLAIATLWADLLTQAGFDCDVQRAWAGSIAGEIPPDQALPELWVRDDNRLEAAREMLQALRTLPHRLWSCPACGETVEGPFEQCWNCGADRPGT